MVVPGSHAVKAQAEAEGLPRSSGPPGRLAGAGLQHVPGDEPGQLAPASGPPAPATATSRAARGVAAAPTWSPPPSPPPPRWQAISPPRQIWSSDMKAVQIIQGRGVPLKRSDVDTDQIIPAEWLKRVERTGFEKGLFSTWRDDRNFVLNDERYVGASILVAGPSFGVGSSRSTPWAIQQAGSMPSSFQLQRHLPQQLHQERWSRWWCRSPVQAIWAAIEADHTVEITIDRPASRWRCRRRDHRLVPDGPADPAPLPRGPRRHRDHAVPRRRHRRLEASRPA